MNAAEQASLVDRILGHLDARTTDVGPTVTTRPVEHFTSPDRYARELDVLFDRGPVAVAHASQVATPGDFVTVDIASRPLLITRAPDGRLHAHLNVCRHRGSRLVEARAGKDCPRFRCPYHGWTYGCDGALQGVPHRSGFPGIDADTHALRPVAATIAGGFVWVGRDAPESIEAGLGPIAALLHSERIAEHTIYDTRRVERALNWKLAIDIFLEAYHLRGTHADSIFPMFFDNVGVIDFSGPHQRGVFPKRSIETQRGTDRATWRLRDHANLLVHLFPNTLVLLQGDHIAVLHVLPLGLERTAIESYTLVPEAPASDKARAHWDANNAILYAATNEDFVRGESIQRGLRSGANDVLTFGRFEHGLSHFHASIDGKLG